MPKFNKIELRVGLFLLVPLVLLLVFIMLKLGYSLSGSTLDVYLKIDSMAFVKNGTPVKLKGFPIGRVVDIKPVYKPTLHFLALMRIQSDVELSEECSAVILNQNIIGDPVIEMKNPDKKGPPLLNGDVLEGIEYVNLEGVLKNVNTLLTSLSTTTDVIRQISMDSKQNLRALVANLSASVANLNAILENSQQDIIAMLASFRETAKTMKEISVELKKHPMKFLFKE